MPLEFGWGRAINGPLRKQSGKMKRLQGMKVSDCASSLGWKCYRCAEIMIAYDGIKNCKRCNTPLQQLSYRTELSRACLRVFRAVKAVAQANFQSRRLL